MNEFTFSVPQNIIVGKGSLAKLPEVAEKLGGKKAFIISGPHLNKMGIVKSCQDAMKEKGIESSSFTETEGNPSVETVDKAAAAFKESGADFIVALGGGSPMDVAKAVGVVARFGGSITEYEGADKVPGDIIPLIAVPTTAGTGSEVTAFSVITDHSRDYKLTVFSYKLIPSYAILDAELLTTAPASVAAIAFSWARLGDVHAMSHPVSAYFNVPHGVANAILLPTIVEYNMLADKGKYFKIYNYIAALPVAPDEFTPDMLVDEILELNEALGIPAGLSEAGVTKDKFDAMADDAMKSGNIAVNPRSTTKKDILALYEKAF